MGLTLSVLTVMASLTMIAYVIWRVRREAPWLLELEGPLWVVQAGDGGVTAVGPDGTRHQIDWPEVRSIVIRTSDVGPLGEDVHWEVTYGDGGAVLAIPGSAPGIDQLLSAGGEYLEGFDHEAVIEAMGSTDMATFQIWPPSGADRVDVPE